MTVKGKVKGAAAVRRWFALAEEALQTHQSRLDRINVYPVADSDTGANMLATIRSSRTAVENTDSDDLGRLLASAGAEAMGSAQGNSGTLLAVLISGLAEPLSGHQRLTVTTLRRGLERASLRGWSALSQPMEGTMLSVLDAAMDESRSQAAAAAEPDSRAALEQAMDPVVQAARGALIQTEHQLEVLSRAGVVDSGGLGLLIVLAALAAAVRGEEIDHSILDGLSGWELPDGDQNDAPSSFLGATGAGEAADQPEPEGVELMCTVLLDPLGAAALRHRLDELGESVIITPIGAEPDQNGSLRWRIHVHTDDVETTLAAVKEAGPLEESSTTPLHR
ncbi:DAK2 domain-containing protein [Nesterenkonia muleiensis]|uniref:DAK2 domain-containing protein n=1 Tax=Nesterenkonia muleiensis TaxID=2282648 RepID=UPI000E7138B3|nr:DAK2 domain-containing protein [Nesterenkonia muleiensis]